MVIYNFDKSLESPWVLTQHHSWQIFFYITKRINDYLDIKKIDLQKPRLFSNQFRFIDRLTTNNHLEFDKNHKDIYPPELKLKNESIFTSEVSFLDLSIIIENDKFKTKLFDTKDAFQFSIVRIKHLDINIPSHIYYGSIGSEI